MKLDKYPKYKDSLIPWFGEIPETWDVLPLSALFRERGENNKALIEQQVLSVLRDVGVIPYEEKGRIGNKKSEDIARYKLVKVDDIVLNSMNVIIGSVGLSRNQGCLSPIYYVLVNRSKDISSRYYSYVFKMKLFQKSLIRFGKGILAHRMRIPMELLKRESLPKPPIEEQDGIARFLRAKEKKIRQFIRNKHQLIQLLKEQKEVIINQTVTQGINPNDRKKSSKVDYVGNIPEHWDVIPLRNLGRFQNGISESAEYFGSGYPFVSYGDVYSNRVLPLNVEGKARSSDEERRRLSVEEGDVLFTRTSETIEEIGLASVCMKSIKDSVFSGFIIRFRPTNQALSKEFSKYYFRSHIARRYFIKEMNIVTRASLAQDLLKRLPVLLPSLSEQKEIFNFLEKASIRIDLAIEKARHQIELVQEYRARLISDVVTGKVDVRNIKVEDVSDEELIDDLSPTEEIKEPEDSVEEVPDED